MLKFQWRGGSPSSDMTQGEAGELKDIKRRLQEDGIDPEASDEQKLRHLWQLYLKTEGSLKASLASIQELRTQQAEEMREVENYVEHIRSLSDEREALTLEFEAENEQLKAEIVRLTNTLDGFKNDEIRDMLLQQNLDEIAMGTTSEQIAYLLVERARLMDELEAEEARVSVQTPEGAMTAAQLLQQLDQERQEFEGELRQQRDSLRVAKENMRQSHEEEISALMSENEKIQDMLNSAKRQTREMAQDVEELRQQVKDQQGALLNNSLTYEEMQLEHESRCKAEEEVLLLQKKVEELEYDNKTLIENAVTLTSQVQEVRSEVEEQQRMMVTHQETEVRDIIDKLEKENCGLTEDIKSLQLKLELAQQETEDFRNQMLTGISSGEDLQTRMKKEIEVLKDQNRSIHSELEEVKRQNTEERWHAAKVQPGRAGEGSHSDHQGASAETEALKTKVRHLENKVSSLEGDLATSQRELWSQQSDFKKIVARARAEGASQEEAKGRDLSFQHQSEGSPPRCNGHHRDEFDGTHREGDNDDTSGVRDAQLKEVTERLQAIAMEKDELYNVLESQRQQNASLRREMASNMDRISTLEGSSYHLRSENSELSAKLSEVQTTITTLEVRIKEESNKVDQHKEKNNEVDEANRSIAKLKQEVDQLNAELGKSQCDLHQAEVKLTTEKKHYEIEVEELKLDRTRLQTSHQMELASLSQRLEQTYNEITSLKNKINLRDEETNQLRKETNTHKTSETNLMIQFDNELQKRLHLELSNNSLQQQSDQAWSQVKELSIKISSLETTNQNLRMELDRKTQNFKETENLLSLRSSDRDSLLESTHRRAEVAETRLYELQKDLESALSQLQSAEDQLRESKVLQAELQQKREEIVRLREQLHDEKFQKSFANQDSEELTTQITVLREKERVALARSHELQHMLLDVESKLETMKEQTQETTSKHHLEEVGKKTMVDQVTTMQRDVEILQSELVTATERYDVQVRKYNERKQRTKNKLQKARELFHTERSKYRGELERLQEQLATAQTSLARENEWKIQMEDNYKKVMVEKRDLLTQIAEQEETVHDQTRSLSVLQVRTRYLEEENHNLQTRIESLTKQKHNLDRLVKEYQLERHKEALDTMSSDVNALMSPRINGHVTNSLTVTTSPNLVPPIIQTPLVAALMSPRVASPIPSSNSHSLYPRSSQIRENRTSSSWEADAVHL